MTSDSLVQNLRKDGFRITKARRLIIELLSNSPTPLTVTDILTHMRVNKTTVYREIESLLVKGYMSEVDFGDGKKRYELTSRGHHHHLVCVKCKSVTDVVVAEDLAKTQKVIEEKNKFTILKHNLEFFGVCSNCQS